MSKKLIKTQSRFERRKHRTNTVMKSHDADYRVVVNKSNKYSYAQVLNKKWEVVAFAFDKWMKRDNKVNWALLVGQSVWKQLSEKWISSVVFDRNGFVYHGRVKAIAEWIRESGVTI